MYQHFVLVKKRKALSPTIVCTYLGKMTTLIQQSVWSGRRFRTSSLEKILPCIKQLWRQMALVRWTLRICRFCRSRALVPFQLDWHRIKKIKKELIPRFGISFYNLSLRFAKILLVIWTTETLNKRFYQFLLQNGTF